MVLKRNHALQIYVDDKEKKKMGIGLTGQHTYTGDRGLTRATTWGDESGGLYQGHMGRGGAETLKSGPFRPDFGPSYLKETIKCLALRKYAIRSCLL